MTPRDTALWGLVILFACLFCATQPAFGQFDTTERAATSWGLRGVLIKPRTELGDDKSLAGSTYLRFGLLPRVQLELNGGLGEMKGSGYRTTLGMADARLILALNTFGNVNPFLYAGGGFTHYDVSKLPPQAVPGYRNKGWAPTVPAGGGLRIRLTETVALEGSASFSYTYRDDINGAPIEKGNDVYWRASLGVTVGSFGRSADRRRPETVVIPERPTPAPVMTRSMPTDRDGDGLMDLEETKEYGTDPDRADTDGDGLADGSEVRRHRTDPTLADTDGGTVPDGAEVSRGSDPLDASDDVPTPEPPGFRGRTVRFDAGVLWVTDELRAVLGAVAEDLMRDPHARVMITGHSDSSGRQDYNLWLSRQRARVVKEFLVEKGVSPERLSTQGAGSAAPAAPNTTAQGRRLNRRVEILPAE